MAIKITKLDTPAGMFMNDIEEAGDTFNLNVGYLLHLIILAGELDNDRYVQRPVITFVTADVRVFTFTIEGCAYILKIEISE